MTDDEFLAEYVRLGHAVQTGVAYSMAGQAEHGAQLGIASPKHLRTGLDLRAADHSALVKLLIAKGVITDAEYKAATLDGLREEIVRYEARLSEQLGAKVTLA